MAGEHNDSEMYGLWRLLINLGGVALSVGIVVVVVATIVVELD